MPVAQFDTIPSGFSGTKETVRRMHRLAEQGKTDLTVQKVADLVIRQSGAAPRDYWKKAQALYSFIKNYIRFERDPFGVEMLQEPLVTLKRKAGDCIPVDQKIVLRHRGTNRYQILPVGDIRDKFVEYDVVSYSGERGRFEFSPITSFAEKGRKPVVKVRTRSGLSFRATPEHKVFGIFLKGGVDSRRFQLDRAPISELQSNEKSTFLGMALAKKIPALHSVNTIPAHQLYVEGLYVAEGYSEAPYKAEVANKDPEIVSKVHSCLNALGVPYRDRNRKDGVTEVFVKASDLSRRLYGMFGRDSFGKHFPEEYLSLSQEDVLTAVDAYADGDGFRPSRGEWAKKASVIYNTVSELLAEQLCFFHLVMGRPLSLWTQENHMGAGVGDQKKMFRAIEWKGHYRAHRERLPGIENSKFTVKDDGEAEVVDISVPVNKNFVTPYGHVISNCDDHSILVGALFSAIGYPYAFKTIRADASRPDEFSHIYTVVNVPGKGWIGSDTSVDAAYLGWEPPGKFDSKVWMPEVDL